MTHGPVLAVASARKLGAVLVSVAMLRPGIIVAEPAGQTSVSKSDLEAFNAASREGLARFDGGDHLGAAEIWLQGVKLLPEILEYRESRANTYAEIAGAYRKVLDAGAQASVLEAALTELDAYVAGFGAIYPAEPVTEEVTSVREALRARLAEIRPDGLPVAVATPADLPPKSQRATVETRPWRGLAIGGSVTTGVGVAMFGMFVGGYVRAKSLEREFDNSCYLSQKSEGTCGDLYDRGLQANGTTTAGLILAPLLVGSGMVMLVLAVRRKASTQVFAPTVGPSTFGWVWQRRF